MKRFGSTLALFVVAESCVVPSLDVIPAAGVYSIEGDFGAAQSGAVVGSDLETMGLDDSEPGIQPRVDLRWTGMRLAVSALGAGFKGDGTTEATIEINGDVIEADAEVRSELDFYDVKGAFTFDILPTDMMELGIGVGVAVLGVDFHVAAKDGSGELDAEESLPVPFAALRAAGHLWRIGLYGEVGYGATSVSDGDLTLGEYELGATFDLFGSGRHLAGKLLLGWRGVDVDTEYEDGDSEVEADFLVNGPFLGFSMSF